MQQTYCSIQGLSKTRNQGDYALYTSVKIWMIDWTKWVIVLTGGVCGGEKRGVSAAVWQPWLLRPCNAAEVRRAIQQVLCCSACVE